jgi:hypothetical protein
MTTNIYILKLEEDKYYIGKSNDVLGEYNEHLAGRRCKWTQLYSPKFLIKTIINVSPEEIYKIFNDYIVNYGIHKVRSDILQEVELNPLSIEIMRRHTILIRNRN